MYTSDLNGLFSQNVATELKKQNYPEQGCLILSGKGQHVYRFPF